MKNCNNCANYKPKDSWTAQVQAFAMRGNDAASLEVVPQPPRPTIIHPGAYIETPIAQQTIESNVKVPLAQSLVTGGIIAGMATCATLYIGLPKPLLIISAASLYSVYRTWTGGVGMADSLLTRIEDYTKIDINRDGQTGSQPRKPRPELRFVRQSGYGSGGNTSVYQPEPQEQTIDIPNMPQINTSPWTVTRLVEFLESAFVTGTWSRAHCRDHHGISQGQWWALREYIRYFEQDSDGKQIITIWGTKDRPTLDGFVEQISAPVIKPTSATND